MSQVFEYKIHYELDKEAGSVTAVIPELNNLASFGDTFAQAEANIAEAALGYFEVLAKENKKIPEPESFNSL